MGRCRLLMVSLLLGMAGCVSPPGVGPILHGHVTVQAKKASLHTAMEASDAVANATVSLIAPDDKTTVAVGLTDVNGAFTLNTPAPANGIYHLIAAKRADGDGRLLQLSSMVSYNGSNWLSITDAPEVVINPTTTAVAIVGDALGVLPADWLRKVTFDSETGDYTTVSPTLVSGSGTALDTTVGVVADQVATLLDLDVDPLRGVCFAGSVTSEGNSPVAAATAGVTLVRVDGFGFDPVAERNSVGFQVGRQFYWTPALAGSTEKTLFARVPAIPPPDISSGAMSVLVHVRNGVGALEVNIDQPPTLALQFPRAVPDTVAQLPADPGAPRLGSFAVGPLSGFVNLVWPDSRYSSVSPILRIWNLQSNVLATTTPQVALTTGPNRASDPGYFPQIFVKETAATDTAPMQILTSVIWQGLHTLTGQNAIFHRVALNGVWQAYTGPGGESASASVAVIDGTAPVDCISPNVVQDGGLLAVTYTVANANGNRDVKVRIWKGGFANSVPNWTETSGAVTGQMTANGSGATAKLPQVAVSKNGPSGASYYHVLWHNSTGPGVLQYRRAFFNTTSSLLWDPNPAPAAGAATFQSAVGTVDDLALAADEAGSLLGVWLSGGTLSAKSVPAGTATSGIAAIGAMSVPPLPGGAQETSPRLVAVGNDDFYLISASTTASNPDAAGEIWLRHWSGGVWTGPVRLSSSPGVDSSFPSLHWNGSSLTASWKEGSTLVYELVIMPL